jgi:hypothetical protein
LVDEEAEAEAEKVVVFLPRDEEKSRAFLAEARRAAGDSSIRDTLEPGDKSAKSSLILAPLFFMLEPLELARSLLAP